MQWKISNYQLIFNRRNTWRILQQEQVMTGSHGQVWLDGSLVSQATAVKATIKLSKEEVKKAKTMSKTI